MLVVNNERNISIMHLRDGLSQGVVAADRHEWLDGDREGTWWLPRLLVQPEYRCQGLGSALVKKLQEELLKNQGFKVLIVAPGGYGSDPGRLFEFYRRQGFTDRADEALEWSRS